MKVKVTLNGKTADIDIPDEKLEELGLKEKKKLTGYERVKRGETYWYKDSTKLETNSEDDRMRNFDDVRYAEANYYSNEKLADDNLRADALMRRLCRFAAENGGIPSVEDWKDASMKKYFIDAFYSNVIRGLVRVELGEICYTRDAFQIYFKSEEACERAIEEFKDELFWYFTEYQAMLY